MHKLIVVTITFGVIVLAKLPPYIHKCSIKDPDLNTCVLNSAKQAVPHLIKGDRMRKLPVLDPLFIIELQASSKTFNGTVYNSTVLGLKDIVLDKVGFDFDKKELTIQATLPSLNFTGTYGLSGKLASLPISGNGQYSTSLFDITSNLKATYNLKKMDDGEVHMMFSDYDCLMTPQKVMCHMENLFNGNKQLGDIMNAFINENWRLIFDEVGKDISMAVGQLIIDILSEWFKSVPYNDIFDGIE